jgi:hypothetical protein
MPANFNPIFPVLPKVQWAVSVTTANTTKDLTSGTISLVFTAGTNGAWLDRIIGQPIGTNVASLARVFLNNGATTATALNNTLIDQIGLPAVTLVENAELPDVVLPLGFAVDPGDRVYITLATAVAGGWQFTCVGGDY